jgi:glycolate oxidase FAD binding subunit
MKVSPADVEELRRQLAELREAGGCVAGVDLGSMDQVLAHEPEDMTITVEAGITVGRLQERAARAGQWLPIDPPHPDRCSVGSLIAGNSSGSRRYGYGTIREHLIGLGVVLADGRLVRSGGRVVKNVAGYDLQKLFVGSRGTLGVIVEATFKLLPVPEAERLVQARCDSLAEAGGLVERVVEARLMPVILDLHNLAGNGSGRTFTVVVGFAGTREFVDQQINRARQIGVDGPFAGDPQDQFWSDPAPAGMVSVLPSSTVEILGGMGEATWLAHAGNGVIHHRGGEVPPGPVLPGALLRRIKAAFDPKGLFPPLPGVEMA